MAFITFGKRQPGCDAKKGRGHDGPIIGDSRVTNSNGWYWQELTHAMSVDPFSREMRRSKDGRRGFQDLRLQMGGAAGFHAGDRS
jgi:hypothetical protein